MKENIIYDLLERQLYQISDIDLIIEDSVTYEENGIDVGRYLKEVFNDDFENEVFQLYSTKTATSVLKAIKNSIHASPLGESYLFIIFFIIWVIVLLHSSLVE